MGRVHNFYKPIGSNRIKCLLCRHYCSLKDGQIGICGVNKNEGGKIVNLVYGKISAINIDPIEKKPLYHFLPGTTSLSIGTVGCNFKCPFCQNWQISQSKSIENYYRVTPEEIVNIALERSSKSISYTYNEPTIFYPFAKDIALLAKRVGLKNIFVSNGFESPEIIDDMVGIIDAFNIDIKSFKSDYYKKYLKGGLDGVLDTLKRLKERNFWIECTTLIVPQDNDSYQELNDIANFITKELDINTPWHITAFYPNYKVNNKDSTPIESLERAYKIGKGVGLNFIYMGNILKTNSTYCPNCKESLIERVGYSIRKNIVKDGRCPKCNSKIAGVWR